MVSNMFKVNNKDTIDNNCWLGYFSGTGQLDTLKQKMPFKKTGLQMFSD